MPEITGLARYTPSQQSPWTGGLADAFTDAQRKKINERGAALKLARERNNLPPTYKVWIPLSARAGDCGERRYGRFLCPTVSATSDRKRICVIAPDGSNQWVEWR